MKKNFNLLSVFLLGLFWGSTLQAAPDDPGLTKLMELINVERVALQKAPLEIAPELMGLAWEWSYRISQEKRLSHRKNLLELCEKYDYRFMNENLHLNLTGEFEPEKVVASWMNSPAHKRNLLEDKIKIMGVGYSRGVDGNLFVVFNGAARVK
ncbi:MAG: CAP domain-containing protein [Blastochloris sp.]|nr:CAP domain-containing protein [Blastochloris sp.]